MLVEQSINRRELLRNFRKYQTLFATKKLDVLTVPILDGLTLDIRLKKEGKTGADMASFMKNIKKPMCIDRPSIDFLSRVHAN
jgi:hypothetical protein